MKLPLAISISWIISGLVYANQITNDCSEHGYTVLLLGSKVKCEVLK